MIALAKLLTISIMVGVVCAVLASGAVGLLTGIPLALREFVPGDEPPELRQLPWHLLAAGMAGMLVGTLAGLGSQLSGRRVNYVVSALIIAACVWTAIVGTHPSPQLAENAGWLDYLESYRITALAGLGGVVAVAVLGLLMRPFSRHGQARPEK